MTLAGGGRAGARYFLAGGHQELRQSRLTGSGRTLSSNAKTEPRPLVPSSRPPGQALVLIRKLRARREARVAGQAPLNAGMRLFPKARPIVRCKAFFGTSLASLDCTSPQSQSPSICSLSQSSPNPGKAASKESSDLEQTSTTDPDIRPTKSTHHHCRKHLRYHCRCPANIDINTSKQIRTASVSAHFIQLWIAAGSRSNVTMPNQQAPAWQQQQQQHSGKPKIEPNEINDLLYANMKRRNDAEERRDVEMNGCNGYANSELSPAPTPAVPRMRPSRPKTVKQTKNNCPLTPGPSGIGSPTSSAPTPTSTCRYDSSLGLLTKKFIDLIKQADDGVLDLNKAADTLHVQKRRIYDITNVLEGIGLIEKKLKNRIRWKGMGMARSEEVKDDAAGLQAEVEELRKQEKKLDESIGEMRERLRSLSEDEHNKQWLYVTEEDIKNLPCFQNETLIAIKAPLGTTLEVPDPDEAVEYPHRRFQILLRSTMGPIDLYLVSRFEAKFDEMNSEEGSMEPGNHVPEATGPSSSGNDVNHGESMAPMVQHEAGYGLSDLAVPMSHEAAAASQSTEPSSNAEQSHADFAGGIMRIAPAETDIDYWLLSDAGVGISDMWRSDPSNAMWDEVVRLNAELGIENIGSPQAHSPPSSNALEVDPVS